MPVEEEKQIIKRILGGDKDAFEELVLASQKNVYNLALKITGNEEDALDISQEAFFKAYLQLGSFRGESRFSVWMYRLTYNLCIDFMRKKPKAKLISLTCTDDDSDAVEHDIPDARETPEEALLRSEKQQVISESIDELGAQHREMLIMREITGMSYGDMAATLMISEGTVKSRLARARKNLVGILAQKGTLPESFRLKEHKEVGGRE